MTDNVIPMFHYRNKNITPTFTCLECLHEFELEIEEGKIQDIPCPTCNTMRTVPFKIVPPPDSADFEVYACACGCEFFRALDEDYTQCIKCGEITQSSDEDDY